MRVVLLALMTISFIKAGVYYAKLEPVETITVKAEVSGKAVVVKKEQEGKIANGLIIKIDDKLDRIDLNNTKESLKLTKQMIKLNQEILPSLKQNMQKKLSLYNKVAPLNSTSLNQKYTLFNAYVSAKSQYSSTKEKILNLKNQKVSLKQKIATLKDKINKKSIKVKNLYLYSLNIAKGEFVNIAMPIAILQDISKAKLTIFLDEDDLKDIDKKSIYLDGKKTDLKFSKIWKVADSNNISSYKAEIILKPIDRFSKLIKVEIK